MLFGKRGPRPPRARRRGRFCPAGERLEGRIVLTAIDLANIAGNVAAPAAGPGPYGVLFGNTAPAQGAGFSVAYVGDTNGDGFDDFVVGAPTINPQGGVQVGVPDLGNGAGARVYLVFGSQDVSPTTFLNWLALPPSQRVADLQFLGDPLAGNPINPSLPGFAFDGLTFFSTNPANLGASVAAAGDVNADGFADFLIGSPNAFDINGANPGTGRAYLVYGGPGLNDIVNDFIAVDAPNPPVGGPAIVTFVNTAIGALTGRGVAGIGDIDGDNLSDIAIGAPAATIGGLANNGAVYVIPGNVLPRTRTSAVINLATIGQLGGLPGVIFAGESVGSAAGFSIAPVGNFNGDRFADFAIGAPTSNLLGAGTAYIINGQAAFGSLATIVNGVSFIPLSLVGATGATTVPGLALTGAAGDQTGFSLSTAGDFNGDGFSDALIGSPGFGAARGAATVIYGRPLTPNPPGPVLGRFPLATIPPAILSTTFVGAAPGALAGYALAAVGRINLDTPNEILIGSPGLNNLAGVVYLIPGNADLLGTVPLDITTVQAAPAQALVMTLSTVPGVPATRAFLGGSLAGRLTPLNAGRTLDLDAIADFVIGAPLFGLTTASIASGAAFAVEGAFIQPFVVVPTPVPTVPVNIGVGSALPPFQINALTPAALQIFVFSNAAVDPDFLPLNIDPSTIVVNGVPFPGATLTPTVPPDLNGDNIPDAIITITPRANLNLVNGVNTFTVTGRTQAGPLEPFSRRFIGTASVTVTGGGVGPTPPTPFPGGGTLFAPTFAGLGPRFVSETTLDIGERFVPQPSTLSRLRWRPLPVHVAYNQFLYKPGFGARLHHLFNPSDDRTPGLGADDDEGFINRLGLGGGIRTLDDHVFTRGRFKVGQHTKRFTHPVPVIPRYMQTEGWDVPPHRRFDD